MRRRRLLLAATALAGGCGGSEPKPRIFANPKGSFYDAGTVAPADAGAGSGDEQPSDAGEAKSP